MNKFIFNLQRFATTNSVTTSEKLRQCLKEGKFGGVTLKGGDIVQLGSDITLAESDVEGTGSSSSTLKYLSVEANVPIILDLNGHTLDAKNYQIQLSGEKNAKLTIKDSSQEQTGKITGSGSYNLFYLYSDTTTLTVESGTIEYNRTGTGTNANASTIYLYKGTVNIKGGNIIYDYTGTESDAGGTHCPVYNFGGTANISGGIVENKTTSYAVYNSGTLDITGGTFKSALNAGYLSANVGGGSGTTSITGGKFSSNTGNLSTKLGTGYGLEQTEGAGTDTKSDDYWEVFKEIPDYNTLKNAVASTGTNGRIKLIADITITDTNFAIERDVVIDLNGHTLNTGNYDGITVKNNVTVKDSSQGQDGKILGGENNGSQNDVFYLQNGKLTIESGTIDKGQKTILFSFPSTGGGEVYITGGKFSVDIGKLDVDSDKITIADGLSANKSGNYWVIGEGSGIPDQSGFTLENGTATYKDSSGNALFTVTGLKSSATASDLNVDTTNKTVTVKSSALDGKNITISGEGYSLALASGAESSSTENTNWSFTNNVAKYATTTTTSSYKVSSDAKTINFSETSSENIFVTVEGVNSANGLEFNETTKILQIPQTSAKNSKITVNGKNFEPESDLQISAPDKNSATLISGKISVESSFTDVDSKTVRVTGGKVSVTVAEQKITSITGLDDGEQVTFDGTTYKKIDGALIIGDKIYENVSADANILSNFTGAGLYAKFVNNFNVETAKQKITGDIAKIYLGSASGYDATYFAILTKDGDKNILQKNSTGEEISNPTLKIDNAAELEIDFAATILAKDTGSYKISGDEVQISDANGYNILTDATGKITGLEKISGGATISNAKNLNLKTDSTGQI